MLPLLLLMFAPADHLPTLEEWTHDWEVQRDFTLAVAQKMPDDYYNFRATPEEMSFGQMTVHIAAALRFRFEQVSGVNPEISIAQPKTKEDVLKIVRESFDYAIRVLPKIPADRLAREYEVDWEGRKTAIGRQILLAMMLHTAHHHAQ